MVDGVRQNEERKKPLVRSILMTNHLMIQQSTSMKIFKILFILIVFNKISYGSNSSCLPCSSDLCYKCFNTLPADRTNVEQLTVICNTVNNSFQYQERFYSIIQSYTTINCSTKTLYLDRYSLWNYLEYMSITYANLTDFSPVIFNRSLSLSSPILYSIRTLNLSHNSLGIINKNFSYYFPSLEKLDLSYNHLILIKQQSFNNLINLKELYLNNNHLKQILPNIFPHKALSIINLNMNYWHCSCTNILTLLMSQPIPKCYTPYAFQYQNISIIAQQCFLRTKTNILIMTNVHKKQNLTCVLSPIIDAWKNKINKNITLLSAWDIEQHRSISLEKLSNSSNQSSNYLVCFNLKSPRSESIYAIINLSSIVSLQPTLFTKFILHTTSTRKPIIIVTESSNKLSPFVLWLFNTSKNILPKSFQKSDKQILIVWLILLIAAFIMFLFLIYFIYSHKAINTHPSKKSRSLFRFDKNPHNHRTLLNVKFTCKNHKCLCQYRRRAHSSLSLTNSTSTNLLGKPTSFIQPASAIPDQLRYAKIKQIPSTKRLDKDYLAGEFRTIVTLKSLPN
ncbi:unnamed protein product [Rotaria magnacalcarata]|uniref:Uncharacterized protein n=4 Tax=Rotaria magnacalcarata TaxID=392030 RepID=A0A816N3C0_9BILA|nr:unnamed protein product [Rotaria magnacalcarata]CAF2125011.1 unnamed protein product [Rotaria magnacalcarata]CAF3873491.1 unnamed protein product [Rotaria magnacalcarata]